jgi:hypothetical protein
MISPSQSIPERLIAKMKAQREEIIQLMETKVSDTKSELEGRHTLVGGQQVQAAALTPSKVRPSTTIDLTITTAPSRKRKKKSVKATPTSSIPHVMPAKQFSVRDVNTRILSAMH